MELRSWLIRGTLVGLVVLGIGGRLLMRVIAHMPSLDDPRPKQNLRMGNSG